MPNDQSQNIKWQARLQSQPKGPIIPISRLTVQPKKGCGYYLLSFILGTVAIISLVLAIFLLYLLHKGYDSPDSHIFTDSFIATTLCLFTFKGWYSWRQVHAPLTLLDKPKDNRISPMLLNSISLAPSPHASNLTTAPLANIPPLIAKATPSVPKEHPMQILDELDMPLPSGHSAHTGLSPLFGVLLGDLAASALYNQNNQTPSPLSSPGSSELLSPSSLSDNAYDAEVVQTLQDLFGEVSPELYEYYINHDGDLSHIEEAFAKQEERYEPYEELHSYHREASDSLFHDDDLEDSLYTAWPDYAEDDDLSAFGGDSSSTDDIFDDRRS